jgi:hypothetical protein
MAQQTWVPFVGKHPQAHLVSGVCAPGNSSKMDRSRLLMRLVVALRPTGSYAVQTTRDRDLTLVQCAFEKKEDAEKFGHAVQARHNGHYPGSASQRTFMFDALATGTINTYCRDEGVEDKITGVFRTNKKMGIIEDAVVPRYGSLAVLF